MVSLRCKIVVSEELMKLAIQYVVIDLGIVRLVVRITPIQRAQLRVNLLTSGLELLENKKCILVERIRNLIVGMIHYTEDAPRVNYSVYISETLGYDYTYLANIFSEVKHISISQYIIIHKIEMVKELLLYNELNLTEIADKMQYSSVSHLSNQFKKITHLSPSVFRRQDMRREIGLENV